MQKFCHHCGTQLTVGAKFCSSCGTSLDSLSAKPTPVQQQPLVPTTFAPAMAGGNDDEEFVDRLTSYKDRIRMNGLDIEIIKDRRSNETVGVAMATPMPYNSSEDRPPVDENILLEQFKKEASAMRPDTKNHVVKPD